MTNEINDGRLSAERKDKLINSLHEIVRRQKETFVSLSLSEDDDIEHQIKKLTAGLDLLDQTLALLKTIEKEERELDN